MLQNLTARQMHPSFYLSYQLAEDKIEHTVDPGFFIGGNKFESYGGTEKESVLEMGVSSPMESLDTAVFGKGGQHQSATMFIGESEFLRGFEVEAGMERFRSIG
jgi:hypothetical protein